MNTRPREQSTIRALFLTENVPYSLDTRIQRETHALAPLGVVSTVISPAGEGEPLHDIQDGMHVYRYPKPSWGEGFFAHVAEYLTSVVAQTCLAHWVFVRHGFDVIHVGNPPDILWFVAAPYKLLGKTFIYDQHDPVPELFEVRWGKKLKGMVRLLYGLEAISYWLADHIITTNQTFREVAIARSGRPESEVTVVRNGPHLATDFPPTEPAPEVRALGRTVVGYLGIMNPQDDLDIFLQMARIIRIDRQRTDIGFVMVGSGDAFPKLQQLRDELGLHDAVLMTGSIPWPQVLATLAAADICIQPDLPSAYNKNLTTNKLMEYMAMGKAAVAFNLPEAQVSGGDTVYFVDTHTTEALADAVLALADDPERRQMLGRKARQRIEITLAWEHQAQNLVRVYEQLFPGLSELAPSERQPLEGQAQELH